MQEESKIKYTRQFPEYCPHCNAYLDCGDTLEAFLEFTEEVYGMTASRVVGNYDLDLDCTTYWICPDCTKNIAPL
jgi:hypothetical protein